MNAPRPPVHTLRHESLEDRFALRLAATLTQHADQMPQDITERLRVARQQAVAKAKLLQATASAGVVVRQTGGAAALGGSPGWWGRMASVLPLAVLVLGLFLIQELQERNQISAAAEIDALLLADDLPPAAYGDPGFAEYLKRGR